MFRFFRIVTGILLCVSSISAAQTTDERAVERVLGKHWKQVSRAAGMIFTGTVLRTERLVPTPGHPVPAVQAKIFVKHAIAGVHSGETVTIREWAAVWSMQPATGNRPTLFFFYPPSSAGLTSPVGGPLGQVPLDSKGNNVARWLTPPDERTRLAFLQRGGVTLPVVSVSQLERAILSAREEKE